MGKHSIKKQVRGSEKVAIWNRLFSHAVATERTLQAGLRKQAPVDRSPVEIYIHGEINETTAHVVAERLHSAPHASEVVVHVNSSGGQVAAAIDILAALWAHGGRKTARVAHAASGAFLVAIGCDRRVAQPGARFLHHSAHYLGTPVTGALREDVNNCMARIWVRAGLTDPAVFLTLERWGDQIRYFNAGDALALGVVHSVEDVFVSRGDIEWRRAIDAQDRLTEHGRARISARLAPYRERAEKRRLAAMRVELAPYLDEQRRRIRAKKRLAARGLAVGRSATEKPDSSAIYDWLPADADEATRRSFDRVAKMFEGGQARFGNAGPARYGRP